MNKNDYYKFFEDLTKEPTPNKYVVISKADNNGNYAMFVYVKDNNKYLCGGHIGLYNSNDNYSPITFEELFKLLEHLQNYNIEIQFNEKFYQMKENELEQFISSNNILKIQNIIRKLGYKIIKLENNSYVELLFYDDTKKKIMLFDILYHKSEPNRCVDVGNITSDRKNKLESGYYTILKEVSEENIIEAIEIVEESAQLDTNCINYFANVDKVIAEYSDMNNYTTKKRISQERTKS